MKGRLLTIRDLRSQFEDWRLQTHPTQGRRASVFTAAPRVILRSFASRLGMDIFGPVVPNRSLETQAAFPNAQIFPIDSRQELFGYDEFYEIYERPDGRAYYRHLVGTYSTRIVEGEMLRAVAALLQKIRVRRTVFNIATFAGTVAIIGAVTQYLLNIGFQLFSERQNLALWFFAAGLLTLILGALALSLTFEWFARTVVRWIGPEEEFNRD